MVDPASRIEQLLLTAEPALAAAFLQMVVTIKSSLTLEDIAEALERGRFDQALDRALRAAPLLSEAYADQFVAAARDTAKFLNKGIGDIQIIYNQTNTAAVNAMQENMLRLVRGFTISQRETVRQVIIDGIRRGLNPREVALNFRNSIGLTARQEGAVRAFQTALEELDATALTRSLRDRRFDRTVTAAIERGEALTGKQIETMVTRYRERMLTHRAVTIARTEALRSTHQGARALYDQAIEEGQLRASDLTQEWHTAADERVRASHEAMNGQLQPYGTPFVSGKGNLLRYPGDPAAPGDEVINCRCALGTRIATLSSVI